MNKKTYIFEVYFEFFNEFWYQIFVMIAYEDSEENPNIKDQKFLFGAQGCLWVCDDGAFSTKVCRQVGFD
jgi:hypothetical protein